MIDSQPDLAPVIRRVRGGYLKIQGTWMPYEVSAPHAMPSIAPHLASSGRSSPVTSVCTSFISTLGFLIHPLQCCMANT
jgi:hypothetical protein